jgi:glycine cleavage system regulatory protein
MSFAGFTRKEARKSTNRKNRALWFFLAIPGRHALFAAMNCFLIMTVLGADRPGLVSSLSEIVARHGGNWLESRMSRMAGQFAGIVRVEIATSAVDALVSDLQGPGASGLTILTVREDLQEIPKRRTLAIDVVGNDRPGILRELAAAIAKAGGNVEELTTGLESAPMSGHPLFRAKGEVSIQEGADIAPLVSAIESLGGDLTVDLTV